MKLDFVPALTANTRDQQTGELRRAIPPITPLKLLGEPVSENRITTLAFSQNITRIVGSLFQPEQREKAKAELINLAKETFTGLKFGEFAGYAGIILANDLLKPEELLDAIAGGLFDNLTAAKQIEDAFIRDAGGVPLPASKYSLGRRINPPLSIDKLQKEDPNFGAFSIKESLQEAIAKDPVLSKAFQKPDALPKVAQSLPFPFHTADLGGPRCCSNSEHNH